jgi:hypothetical protein
MYDSNQGGKSWIFDCPDRFDCQLISSGCPHSFIARNSQPKFFNKHKICVLEHQENTVTSLVSFHRKSEYINGRNEINCCQIVKKGNKNE